MTYSPGPPRYPPMGPPPGPPIVRASMVVDPDCARRMARSATLDTRRTVLVFLASFVPALLVGGLSYPRRGTAAADVDFGERVLVGVLVGLGVFVVVVGLVLAALGGIVRPRIQQLYAVSLPVGSFLQVDYYADRMVATSAGGVVRETPFIGLGRVRATPTCVTFGRTGFGSGVLPIEVVPPAAVQLLTGGPPLR